MVIIIHGGGWTANNEDIMRGLGRELAKTGRYVAFSMTYRLAGLTDGDSEPNTMADLIIDVWEFWPTGVAEGDVAQFKTDLQAAVKAVEPSYGVFANVDDFDDAHEWNEHVSPIDKIPDSSARVLPPQHLTRGSVDFLASAPSLLDCQAASAAAGQDSFIDTIDGANHAFLDWKPHDGTIETFNGFGMEGIRLMLEFYDGVFYPSHGRRTCRPLAAIGASDRFE